MSPLHSQLELTLNPRRTRLRPISNGIDFLGYIVRPKYILCRNRVVNNLKTRLHEFERQLIHIQDGVQRISYNLEVLESLFACLNSYLGHFKHADTFQLTQQIFQRYTYLKHYVVYKRGKLLRLYVTPTYFWNLRSQYAYFQNRFYQSIMFFQVGCFYGFYGALHSGYPVVVIKQTGRQLQHTAERNMDVKYIPIHKEERKC